MATKPGTAVEVVIPKPNIQEMEVIIEGSSPLIYHKWSEKAKAMIRDKQAKKASSQTREVRNPEEEYINSFYYTSDGFIAFPALSIKQAIVGSARNIDGIAMTELRGAIFVVGDQDGMIPVLVNGEQVKPSKTNFDGQFGENIFGVDTEIPQIEMREDMVRVGMGSADLRYRGQVKNWSMRFVVRFNAGKLSAEQVMNLLQFAGFSCGLGEWRPERDGTYGTFELHNEA